MQDNVAVHCETTLLSRLHGGARCRKVHLRPCRPELDIRINLNPIFGQVDDELVIDLGRNRDKVDCETTVLIAPSLLYQNPGLRREKQVVL
jgi:hypothetical protein